MNETYFYLHGFASGPQSAKAKYLRDRFAGRNLTLRMPDLNQGDFTHLTLTRQLQQIATEFASLGASTSITVIGSSFGGLTAAWLAEHHPQVERLILLAPAFQFLTHWLPKLGEAKLQNWQSEQLLSVYHYAAQQTQFLKYDFVTDLLNYSEESLQRSVPTLILHGTQDEVIPVQASREFAAQRPWVSLIELDSDHALGNVSSTLWYAIQDFCGLLSA